MAGINKQLIALETMSGFYQGKFSFYPGSYCGNSAGNYYYQKTTIPKTK